MWPLLFWYCDKRPRPLIEEIADLGLEDPELMMVEWRLQDAERANWKWTFETSVSAPPVPHFLQQGHTIYSSLNSHKVGTMCWKFPRLMGDISKQNIR